MKINRKNWQEFNFERVFTISRGKRLVKLDQINGDIAYISSSKKNNGVDNYISPPEYMIIYENALTISNSGSVGYCFYHNYKFVASDHCTVIKIRDKKIKLNNHIALFLKPIIESMRNKYNFAREINNERLKKERILLPSTKGGLPNWNFMENYVKKLSQKIKYDKKIVDRRVIKRKLKLLPKEWQEFKIKKFFNIQKGERLVVTNRSSGNIPLLTASSVNNGVSGFIDYDVFKDKKKLFANKITVDMFCNVFYQEFNYFSDDNIHTLLFKNKDHEKYYENKYVNLFLVTILRQLASKYDYGRQLRLKRFEEEIIKLPIIKQDKVDFKFMENFMKSLAHSSSV